jgi:multiple sugar transport system ATP-binding protein
MAALSILQVQKRYGNVQILRGIDLAIADGEFLILVGPSGCGKSTLLNMIAGLEDITEGDIVIGERRVNDLSPKDRDIAMVFQSYALYPSMTVQENIEFGMRMKKVPKAERQAVVSRVAKTLQIQPLLNRRPAQLSGGQRQRVAMGRALARNPAIFLFDEPLSNLDAKLRVEMRAEIKALHQRLKSTIVYVTHDQVEAMTLGDRIAVMKDGLVQQFGTPAEIYERPVNMYVAGFIGSPTMNFIEAQLVAAASGWSARLDGLPHALPLPLSPDEARPGTRAILGIRPEHFHLTAPETPGALPVQVELTEPTGADTFIAGRLGGQKVTLRCSPKDLLRPGDTAWFGIDGDAISLFDPQTQLRIPVAHLPGD